MRETRQNQTVLIVDDHTLVRSGLKRLVEDHPDTGVILESGTGEHALDCTARQRVDMVILDLSLPGMDGMQTSQQLLELNPALKIIILTGIDAQEQIKPLFRDGISAFLTKGCTAAEMHRAIDCAIDGETFVSADAARDLALAADEINDTSPFAKLSRREHEVALLLLEGKRNRQISESLFISEKTVSTHRQNVLQKVGVNNTVELAGLAIRCGYWQNPPMS